MTSAQITSLNSQGIVCFIIRLVRISMTGVHLAYFLMNTIQENRFGAIPDFG